MKRPWQTGLVVALLLALGPNLAWAQRFDARSIEVDVVNDRGRAFPQYPVRRAGGPMSYRAHLEAVQGQRYAIQIRNRTNERIGVVIAVDGRNIISGERSNLGRDERMYVLGPYQQQTYDGWRTGRDRVNRFYFTDAGDSYAGAWGDHSAMGVIAVVAFREIPPLSPPPRQPWAEGRDDRAEDRRGLQSAPPAAARGLQRSEPGTGSGESEWSPSQRVEFVPERRPFARYFLKYSWRDTLCRERVIDCDDRRRPPRNRFWDRDEFAPPPPSWRDEWR
jgi:hypothetical protein